MGPTEPQFRRPSFAERVFNRLFGAMVWLGLGLKHNWLLRVRGRKSGRIYSTPIDLLEFRGKLYLVAPRGQTQWVRNARAAGEVQLKRGFQSHRYRLRALGESEKPDILKAYLDKFRMTVQRYFPVQAGSAAEAFAVLAPQYPAFELIPA